MLLDGQDPVRDGAPTDRRTRGRRETTHVSPSVLSPMAGCSRERWGGALEMNKERSSGLKLSLGVMAAVSTSINLERRLVN